LDPFNEVPDERIIELLKNAKLEYLLEKEQAPEEDEEAEKADSSKVSSEKVKAGLNFKVTENGGNLAVGEK
jgi:ABC-type multidrug transport system fused ATPase/permease subunit